MAISGKNHQWMLGAVGASRKEKIIYVISKTLPMKCHAPLEFHNFTGGTLMKVGGHRVPFDIMD